LNAENRGVQYEIRSIERVSKETLGFAEYGFLIKVRDAELAEALCRD